MKRVSLCQFLRTLVEWYSRKQSYIFAIEYPLIDPLNLPPSGRDESGVGGEQVPVLAAEDHITPRRIREVRRGPQDDHEQQRPDRDSAR